MNDIYLDDYICNDWDNCKEYLAIMGNVEKRRYKYYRDPNIASPTELSELQKLSINRVMTCRDLYSYRVERNARNSKKIKLRSYIHKSYRYDDMNELERFGTGEYARKYIVLISFEDALDFIYCDLFKTKAGAMMEFCKDNGLNYYLYSRQILGGGKVRDILMNELIGYSESYDIAVRNIGNNNSLEKRLFFMNFMRFCKDFRNSLLISCGRNLDYDDDVVMASVGVSSIVYYSNIFIDGIIQVYNKMHAIKLKIMCYDRDKYLEVIDDSLSCW